MGHLPKPHLNKCEPNRTEPSRTRLASITPRTSDRSKTLTPHHSRQACSFATAPLLCLSRPPPPSRKHFHTHARTSSPSAGRRKLSAQGKKSQPHT